MESANERRKHLITSKDRYTPQKRRHTFVTAAAAAAKPSTKWIQFVNNKPPGPICRSANIDGKYSSDDIKKH